MSKNVSMYHYTTEDGIRGMLQSGQINESHDTRRDCLHGVGVYGTAVVPSAGAEAIAQNTMGSVPRGDESMY